MSILDPSYMIDLGGIDVIQSQGVAIPGLYQKLLDNIGPCGNPLIYNWKFNGVFIPPQYVEPILDDDAIYINDIYVSSDDVVHIPSIEIQPTIIQLNVSENGDYEAPEGVDGYNPVSVDVQPRIVPMNIFSNGIYEAPEGFAGFNPVVVNVAGEIDPFALKNYIQSSGTQYIDTGYYIKSNTWVEVICNVATTSSYASLFGTESTGSNRFGIDRSASGGNMVDSHGSTTSTFGTIGNFTDVKTRVKKTATSGSKIETSDLACAFTSYNNTYTQSPVSLVLFARRSSGSVNSYATMKLYRFRIYEGDNLVHEFIPWEENGVACLKDTVTSEIKYNVGTGDFTYGTDT